MPTTGLVWTGEQVNPTRQQLCARVRSLNACPRQTIVGVSRCNRQSVEQRWLSKQAQHRMAAISTKCSSADVPLRFEQANQRRFKAPRIAASVKPVTEGERKRALPFCAAARVVVIANSRRDVPLSDVDDFVLAIEEDVNAIPPITKRLEIDLEEAASKKGLH